MVGQTNSYSKNLPFKYFSEQIVDIVRYNNPLNSGEIVCANEQMKNTLLKLDEKSIIYKEKEKKIFLYKSPFIELERTKLKKEKLETAPNPSRFEEFIVLKSNLGFTINDNDYVFYYDEFNGWFDEFDNYYDKDGLSCNK